MMKHVVINYSKSLVSFSSSNEVNNLKNNIIDLNLSNFIAVLGGSIKNKQMISGLMADVVSCLYLSHGLIWYNNQYNNNFDNITEISLKYLNIEAENKMNTIIDNYILFLKPLLKLNKTKTRNIILEDFNNLYQSLENNSIISHLDEMIYYENDDILGKLNRLNDLDKNSKEYLDLYQVL